MGSQETIHSIYVKRRENGQDPGLSDVSIELNDGNVGFTCWKRCSSSSKLY